MTITAAVADFFSSLAELLSSVFGTAYWLAHSFVTGFVGLVVGLLSFARNMASGALDLAGNVGRFVTGNFVILCLVVAAGYAYMRFIQKPQQQQQRQQQEQEQQSRKPVVANGAGAEGKAAH